MKRVLTFLLVLSALLTLPLSAYAHDVPQNRNDCSIEIIVRYDGENVDGGTLTAIKIGYVDEENGNFFFCQEYTGLPLEDITSSGAAADQEDFYNNNKSNHSFYTQTQTVKTGKATFSGLSTGVYLIQQNTAAKGFARIDSFLVSVPYMENGVYQYQVTALIKSDLEREPEPTKAPPTPPGNKLPQTGQLNWPVPLMAFAGLAVFAIGWVLYFGDKERYI